MYNRAAEDVRKIVSKVGVCAILEQCAEECAELSKACLKLSRKLRDENPTPVTYEQLANDLSEEIGDVTLLTMYLVLLDIADNKTVDNTMNLKAQRWLDRLAEEES